MRAVAPDFGRDFPECPSALTSLPDAAALGPQAGLDKMSKGHMLADVVAIIGTRPAGGTGACSVGLCGDSLDTPSSA